MARIKAINRTLTAKTRQLQFVWRHKIMDASGQTTDGKEVEVIDAGLYNYQGNAPDFFNAKLRINSTLWVGNVSVLENASDWYLYGMDKDKSYDNVVLAVVGNADTDIINTKGDYISVMQMEVPQKVAKRYLILASDQGQAVCHQNVKENITRLTLRSWLCAIQTERLEWQTEEIRRRAKEFGGWDAAYFVTIARTFGMGVNGDLMERWAKSIPISVIEQRADDLFQLEALFLGQAGLLELDTIPEQFQHDALNEGYFAKLRKEYLYLAHKYSLLPLDGKQWKPMGKGSNRYPHSAFSFLANMYYQRKTSLQSMLACETAKEVTSLLNVSATPYWQTRSHFGAECKTCAKHLSVERLNLIVINAVVPMLFAYGREMSKEVYCDRAFDIIEQCKAETNAITKHWEQYGIKTDTAGDSQALIQLQCEYCDKRRCLRCRFGYEYLRGRTKIEGYRNIAIVPDLFAELY
ncbi:MAG: DUF2851 family protein [Prevotella sp.]|nr:DUF2851 family protein [Prevotella sp.]